MTATKHNPVADMRSLLAATWTSVCRQQVGSASLGRARAICGLVFLAAVLAGCGSRPSPGLSLVSAEGGASRVDMLVATTRKPSEDLGLRFGGERALGPSFARLAVSIPPNHKTGDVTWSSSGRPNAATEFAAVSYTDIDRAKVRETIRAKVRASGRRHILIFVHGYNTRFDEAAFRLAQIVHDSRAPVTPILFSWPSWGSLASYPYDRESAAVSRDALETILTEAAEEPMVTQVSVLAHSMGGWLTLESLRQMVIRNRTVHPKITDVMLASPDIDIDVAGSLGRTLVTARKRPKLTLFVSADDRALGASRLLWGSRDRLGAIDPDKEPYRSGLARAGVEVIDLTAVKSSDSLNHGKFASSPPVVQAIGRRLAEGQTLHAETSAGEAAQATTQGAVRLVGDIITAPIRIITPSAP
jgi:esterase/lipase superfamily enzyme